MHSSSMRWKATFIGADVLDQAQREAAVLRLQMRHARGEGGSADGGHEHRHGVAQVHHSRRRVVAAKHALPP